MNDFVKSSIQMISTGEKNGTLSLSNGALRARQRFQKNIAKLLSNIGEKIKSILVWLRQQRQYYLVSVESCGTNELFFNFVFKDGEKSCIFKLQSH